VDAVELATVVYLPPEEVYDFLVDFPGYARYSKYLTDVSVDGEGGPGTVYDITFSWWKLSYTARSRVTDVEPPNHVDWRLIKDIDATGYWHVEAVDPPEDRDHASEVTFRVEFRPESADASALDLPSFVSLDWVVRKVKPKVRDEAERVVRRVVADLEGEPRAVDLDVRTGPESL
jgi:uncharacterized membrane protein